ncbi:MAG: CBS domain-containing protein [Gemmatimonadaceae bacterium]
MKLAELITPDRVVIPLGAGSDTRRTTLAEAASELSERLAANGAVSDPVKLRNRVSEERGEDIVALGDRAFLAHYRTDAVRDLVVAIGVARRAICRELGEGESQQARIVLLILAPPRLAARYLQVLGAFARLLSEPEAVEQILAAATPADFAALQVLRDIELPEQLTVREIMTERPRMATPDTPIKEAARAMARGGISALPVVEKNDLLIGMLSERELMRHLIGSYLQGGGTRRPPLQNSVNVKTVREVMTRQVLAVSPDQALADAAALMTNKDVDNLPVVQEGKLVGFLTRGDIIRKLIGP